MNVKYIVTTSSKLSELSVVSGQLIYLSDKNMSFYDMGVKRNPISSMRLVPSLPSAEDALEGVLYGVVNSSGHVDASVWVESEQVYKQLSGYVATTSSLGLVQPDGTTITIDENGVISCHAEVTSLPSSSITYDNTESGIEATEAQSAIDEVVTIANVASSSASSALIKADEAASSAESASTSAAAAQQNAANASLAAQQAQADASAASTAASSALSQASNALEVATGAASLAGTAKDTADSAESKATTAQTTAESAASAASAAQTAAESAATAAGTAQTAAETASASVAAFEARIAALEAAIAFSLDVEDKNVTP